MAEISKGTSLGMRDSYFVELLKIFKGDPKTFFISADNGAPTMDPISELPGQFHNVGIAEQQAVTMASGMAKEGRKLWFYAIDPFVTVRVVEAVKLNMCAMNLHITALGVGTGYSYDNMGPTHHALGNIAVVRPWPNLSIYSPSDNAIASALAYLNYENAGPQYVKFDRHTLDNIYEPNGFNIRDGLAIPREGTDLCIISTGRMVHNSLQIAEKLEKLGISVKIIDLFRLKPINVPLLLAHLANIGKIVTYEEDYLIGGMGSAIAEIMVDNEIWKPVLRIGQKDIFVYDLGGREVIWEKYGLDVNSVIKRIRDWMTI